MQLFDDLFLESLLSSGNLFIPCRPETQRDLFVSYAIFRCFLLTQTSWLTLFVCSLSQNCFELYIPDHKDQVIKACKTEADGRVVEGNHTFYRISAPTAEEKDEWISSIKWATFTLWWWWFPGSLCYLTLLHLPPAELPSVKTRSTRCWLLGRRRCRLWRGCRGLNKLWLYDWTWCSWTCHAFHRSPSSVLLRLQVWPSVEGFISHPEMKGLCLFIFKTSPSEHCTPAALCRWRVRFTSETQWVTADEWITLYINVIQSLKYFSLQAIGWFSRRGLNLNNRLKHLRRYQLEKNKVGDRSCFGCWTSSFSLILHKMLFFFLSLFSYCCRSFVKALLMKIKVKA